MVVVWGAQDGGDGDGGLRGSFCEGRGLRTRTGNSGLEGPHMCVLSQVAGDTCCSDVAGCVSLGTTRDLST